MKKLIEEIDKYVKKVPPPPANIRDLLVQFAPWAAILTVLISLPAVLAIFGAGAYFGAYGMAGYGYAGWGIRYTIATLFLIANLVIRGLSISGLFAKSIKGWNLLFYSVLLYFVYAIFNFDVIGGIVSTLISLYLIFQIRTYYK